MESRQQKRKYYTVYQQAFLEQAIISIFLETMTKRNLVSMDGVTTNLPILYNFPSFVI